MTGPKIITLCIDNSLKVWNIYGGLIGQIYVNDFKTSDWNVQLYTEE
jgi:hypothetical protein